MGDEQVHATRIPRICLPAAFHFQPYLHAWAMDRSDDPGNLFAHDPRQDDEAAKRWEEFQGRSLSEKRGEVQ